MRTRFARQLLRSAEIDRPAAGARERALGALGLSSHGPGRALANAVLCAALSLAVVAPLCASGPSRAASAEVGGLCTPGIEAPPCAREAASWARGVAGGSSGGSSGSGGASGQGGGG